MQLRLVYTTFPSDEIALEIADQLVTEGLIRCANILGAGRSVYRWEGKTENSNETFVLLKTTEDKIETLERRLHEFHPYEVPAFIVLTPESVSKAYHRWLTGSE